MEKINITWHPVYNYSDITHYTVYAWVGHKLLGEVIGTRQTAATERAAKRIAREMRIKWA